MRNYLYASVATVAIAAAAVMASVTSADAQIVTLFQGDLTASVDVPAPAGHTEELEGPLGPVGGLVGGPIEIHDTIDQTLLRITVQDCCLGGDQYEVILQGGELAVPTSLGLTDLVPLNPGPPLSSGTFIYYPDGGIPASTIFTLSIWDRTLSYIGGPDPWPGGGGIVGPEYSPAGLSVTVESIVPEPASMALLGTALVGFGIAARRRRREPERQEAA